MLALCSDVTNFLVSSSPQKASSVNQKTNHHTYRINGPEQSWGEIFSCHISYKTDCGGYIDFCKEGKFPIFVKKDLIKYHQLDDIVDVTKWFLHSETDMTKMTDAYRNFAG